MKAYKFRNSLSFAGNNKDVYIVGHGGELVLASDENIQVDAEKILINPKNRNHKKEYEQKRDTKRVSFNKEKEAVLLEFANSVDFSNWVKEKIKLEIKQND